jgi:hypothetical protein
MCLHLVSLLLAASSAAFAVLLACLRNMWDVTADMWSHMQVAAFIITCAVVLHEQSLAPTLRSFGLLWVVCCCGLLWFAVVSCGVPLCLLLVLAKPLLTQWTLCGGFGVPRRKTLLSGVHV